VYATGRDRPGGRLPTAVEPSPESQDKTIAAFRKAFGPHVKRLGSRDRRKGR